MIEPELKRFNRFIYNPTYANRENRESMDKLQEISTDENKIENKDVIATGKKREIINDELDSSKGAEPIS